ncbi:hypothetical protein [Fontivita pretiosa]|uniref:hypothetical protein n=1 Tax=Fontivita pretiosa TaxID=2989684 RepID=UPI003D182268
MNRRTGDYLVEPLEPRTLLNSTAPPVPSPFLFMSGYTDSAKNEFLKILPQYTAIGGLTSDAELVKELRSQGKLFLHQTVANPSHSVQQMVNTWSAPFQNTLGGALPGGFDAIQIDEFGAYPNGSPESERLIAALAQLRQQYPNKRIFVWSVWQLADGGPNTLYGNPAVSYSNLLNAINAYADRYMLEVYINERNPQLYLFDPFADNIDSFAPGLRQKTVFGIYIPQSGFVADDSATVGFYGLLDAQMHQIRNSPKTSMIDGAAFWIWYRTEPITAQYIGKLVDHYFVRDQTSYFGDGSMSQNIANPQFESSTSGWTLSPGTGGLITRFNYTIEGIVNYHDDYGYATHQSWGLKMVRGSSPNSATYTASVIPGRTYTVSAFVTAAAGSSAERARVTVSTLGGQNLAAREVQDAPRSVVNGTWKRVIYNFNVPAGQTSVRVTLGDNGATPGNVLYWDFVELEEAFVADTTPPAVVSGQFVFNGEPQSLRFVFSENVRASLSAADLLLTDNLTGTTVAPEKIALSYDAPTDTATFTFPGFAGGVLPSGYYTAAFAPGSVSDVAGNALGGGFALNFLYVAGDGSGDTIHARRSANGTMLQVWRNLPTTASPTFSVPFDTLHSFAIDGLGGDDALWLDSSNGDVRPTGQGGFGFRLGTGNETLNLIGPATWSFADDPSIETPNLTISAGGGAAIAFAAPVTRLAGLQVGAGARASVQAGGNRVIVLRSLTIDGGTLDLNDNHLIYAYTGPSPLQAVIGLIRAARSGGTWLGSGLTSTAAKSAILHNTTLGVMEASDYLALHGPGALFAGQTVIGPAILVRYTYYGDATLDGRVDARDLYALAAHFQTSGSWVAGDFDYNGLVDTLDLNLLSMNWQAGTSDPLQTVMPASRATPARRVIAASVVQRSI